ncbi:hypothetical protein F5144DRAFT_654776 [Chaetomium tenue]|uniref:Uncharacterized protein n=1 Tax=Chaetomium tenue TaxID=1854479 RepID=A0ACB7P367_9PEZI|nr:hypothetical protein F5144DRAFT_654776 [Chaetomium globosum]
MAIPQPEGGWRGRLTTSTPWLWGGSASNAMRNFANLDFEARVPVPFSVFPSSYRESETATQTHVHEEVEIKLPQLAGREGQHSSPPVQAHLPPAGEDSFKEEVRITHQEEERRRPGIHKEFVYREDHHDHHHHHHHHKPQKTYTESRVEFDHKHRPENSVIDVAESEYRSRIQSNYHKEASTVDSSRFGHRHHHHKAPSHVDDYTVDTPVSRPTYKESVYVTGTTVDAPAAPRSTFKSKVDIVEETVDTPRRDTQSSKMAYYDEDGQDRIEAVESRETRRSPKSPNTVSIPCHHIRLGDILILQGRPCQVIRISTSAATGQHRYLGVDLFTKQLHEESSFVSNPAPSVVVQTMIGPVFKQYRVLDMQDGHIVAMTETGDVKQNLPVIDQSSLWNRLKKAFESGRGSVRVLVVTDNGSEMAVDMKVVHGSRL